MERKLVISTDGATIGVEQCGLNPLEIYAVFQMLGAALERGQFPFPKPQPVNNSEPEPTP